MFSGGLCKVTVFCLLMFLLTVSAAAQQADCTAIYEKLVANVKGPELAKYKTALASGQEYLTKCSNEPDEAVKNYVTKQVAGLTDKVKGLELMARFDDAIKADNMDDLVAAGKELLARNHANSLDIMIILAAAGYNKASAKPAVDTFNEDTMRYAKSVLEKISTGATSKEYGFLKYRYKTKACADGAVNTTGWMNYAIGYILSARQKKTKEALPYYYKATQTGCETKGMAVIYRSIAEWYIGEAQKVEADMLQKQTAANNEVTDEVKALDALRRGYYDRALDAQARAFKAAEATSPASKDTNYDRLKEIYEARFDGKLDGIDQAVAKIPPMPFPDPASEVKPIAPPPPATPAEPVPAKPATKTTKKSTKTTKKKTTTKK